MAYLGGIDISHHNYSWVKAQPKQYIYNIARDGFVIMKATEGATWIDPRYNEYIRMIGEQAVMKGAVQVGAYHYARPEYNLPEAEAKNFLDMVWKYSGHMLYALDVEGRALTVPDLDGWCRKWLDAVYKETGVKPLVYCQRSALKLFSKVPEGDYGLWLASWTKTKPKDTQPWDFMAIWQNNSLNIDTDIFFGGAGQWRKYAGGS